MPLHADVFTLRDWCVEKARCFSGWVPNNAACIALPSLAAGWIRPSPLTRRSDGQPRSSISICQTEFYRELMDTQRIIALVVFMFSGMLLWQAWEKYGQPARPTQSATQAQSGVPVPAVGKDAVAVPIPTVPLGPATGASNPSAPVLAIPSTGTRISVTTDTLKVELDTQGATCVK